VSPLVFLVSSIAYKAYKRQSGWAVCLTVCAVCMHGVQTNVLMHILIYRQTDRQIDRQTDRHTHTHFHV